MILFGLHIGRIVYVFHMFLIVTQCINLIAENKIITILQIVSMFKNFCCCNAAMSDLYDDKSKNKITIIFFS